MSSDAELLQRYARERDERAFAEIVERHLGLVYAAALRRTGGRAHLAEEIAQKVFTDLARKAALLGGHPTLTGWLYRSARYVAIDVIRGENRRAKLNQNFAAMPDHDTPSAPLEWEQLRPVLDEALDQLKKSDREAMLLRYFEGLSFAEVGARLQLSENAARMRTERALDKLRGHLGRMGVTSTSAALGLLLANQALASAPAGLAATVTSSSLAAAPAAGGVVGFLLMSKVTAPAISAVIAAGVTAFLWISVVPTTSSEELSALRAENVRLTQATAPGAPVETLTAAANEYAVQAAAIARGMTLRQTARTGSSGTAAAPIALASANAAPGGHRNRGTATAHDAALTFAWAGDLGDPDEIARLIFFDPDARAKAQAILDTMPDSLRAQYSTPEAFYGLLLAASQLEAPPPGADVIEANMEIVALRSDRVAMRRKGSGHTLAEYQLTEAGWKYVLPLAGVQGLPGILNSETLANLGKP